MQTETMTVDDFILIPDNPAQRDTKFHARRAMKGHLKNAAPTHCRVSIARKGKQMWKLDGHTRSYLWDEMFLDQPNELIVDVYDVKNAAEAVELYNMFDNQAATETNTDKIQGACRLHGITVYKPTFLRGCGLRTALINVACVAQGHLGRTHMPTELELVGEFKHELQLILNEKWDRTSQNDAPGTPSCVIATMLLTLKIHGNAAMSFWESYYLDQGTKTKTGRNGVQIAVDWIRTCRMKNELMSSSNYFRNMEVLLNAFALWNNKNKKANITFGDYYTRAKTAKLQMDAVAIWLIDHDQTLALKCLPQQELELL